MKSVCNKLEKSMMEVKVEFSKEEWQQAQDKALTKIARTAKLDGFRQGKAPKQMVKARVGMGQILEDASDIILENKYNAIIVDNGIEPVGQPTVAIDEINKDVFKITVTAPVSPDFELGQYKGLDIKKEEVEVTEEDINNKLVDYQNQFAELVLKEEGEIEEGNTAVIDFTGYKDGEEFDGGSATDYSLEVGSGTFIPGFEDQLIGMGIEEEKDINVTFPEDYQMPDLAGQDVVFKVKVHDIKYKVLPEIDDDLALDVNIDGVETLDDLKSHINDELKNQKETEAEDNFNEKIYNTLVENTTIELPDVMVENEIDNMMNEIEQSLSQQGLTMDQYKQITGNSDDDIRDDIREQAAFRVKLDLILDKIVDTEKIEVTDEEMDKEYQDIAEYYERDIEEVKSAFASQEDMLKRDIASTKALDFVKENLAE